MLAKEDFISILSELGSIFKYPRYSWGCQLQKMIYRHKLKAIICSGSPTINKNFKF